VPASRLSRRARYCRHMVTITDPMNARHHGPYAVRHIRDDAAASVRYWVLQSRALVPGECQRSSIGQAAPLRPSAVALRPRLSKPPEVIVNSTGSLSRSGSSNTSCPSMRRRVYPSRRRPFVRVSTDTSNFLPQPNGSSRSTTAVPPFRRMTAAASAVRCSSMWA